MTAARIALHIGDRVTGPTLEEDGTVVDILAEKGLGGLDLVRVYWRGHGTVNAHYPGELLRMV